ncbi:MAG: hypothetical protein DDT25_00029 [Chloroflexi bacterium]|nr:hypothetical protein [Chloroflexota bacterium]
MTPILLDAELYGDSFKGEMAKATAGQQRLAQRLIEDAGGEGDVFMFHPGVAGKTPAQVGAVMRPPGNTRIIQVKIIPHLPTIVLVVGGNGDARRFDLAEAKEHLRAVKRLRLLMKPDSYAGFRGHILWYLKCTDIARYIERALSALSFK